MPTVIALLILLLLTVPATAQEARMFGTTDLTTHRIHAYAFTGNSGVDNANVKMNPSSRARYCTSGSGCTFGAAVSLPTGARIERFAVHGCNATAGGIFQAVLWRFSNNGGVAEDIAKLVDATACMTYNVFLVPPHTIDNINHSYFVEIFIRGDGVTDTTQFQWVSVDYRLQVSPAPAVATFNDVPTNHPFFALIEALVAAGITVGCNESPPLFCPEGLVTRKQMAAFIARALGLHWAP